MTNAVILITGATDGIGLETAKRLAPKGYHILLHGRSADKLATVQSALSKMPGSSTIETIKADFSRLEDVEAMASEILKSHDRIDVLINNAGVYKTSQPRTPDGYDLRFAVNLFAPVILTHKLLPIIPTTGRIVNLSSAAQSPVDIDAVKGEIEIADMPAYAQSKLAFTMWTRAMAASHPNGPLFVAVNPGSLLNTNMVKAGWGGSDNDISIGANILVKAAISADFEGRSGQYFDNDKGRFTEPHPDALNATKAQSIITVINDILKL